MRPVFFSPWKTVVVVRCAQLYLIIWTKLSWLPWPTIAFRHHRCPALPRRRVAAAAVTHYHAEITFQPSCCPSSAQLYPQLDRRVVFEEILRQQVSNTYYVWMLWKKRKYRNSLAIPTPLRLHKIVLPMDNGHVIRALFKNIPNYWPIWADGPNNLWGIWGISS